MDAGRVAEFVHRVVSGRDVDLDGHHHRVDGARARAFAHRAGCSKGEAELLSIGAAMHDLGKLAINEQILNKTTRLTEAEFFLVKQHPRIGHEQLQALDLDQRIGEIVLNHHENYDGSGYPHGLAGDSIPRLARMVRILDTFDAVTMDRPYHKGVSALEALVILRRDVRWYDPELLPIFCETIES